MPRRETSDLERTTERLSAISLEHRELARELQKSARDISEQPRAHPNAVQQKERPALARPTLVPEHASGEIIVALNSRNRSEWRATVTHSDNERAHFVLDSGRATWRIPRNMRQLRGNELKIDRVASEVTSQTAPDGGGQGNRNDTGRGDEAAGGFGARKRKP